jgi:hypothetical protein
MIEASDMLAHLPLQPLLGFFLAQKLVQNDKTSWLTHITLALTHPEYVILKALKNLVYTP